MMDSELNDVDDNVDMDAIEDQEADNLDDAVDALDDGYDADQGDAESDDDQEPADEEGEQEEVEGEGEAEVGDDVVVTLDTGDAVPLSELKAGYLKGKDYTHKTTELSVERDQVAELRSNYEERTQFAETTLRNLTEYLEGLVPPEPSLQLAQSDPATYQYQRALREQAMGELGQLVQMGQGVSSAQKGYSEQDMAQLRAEENAKLVKSMPHLADPSKRAAFDNQIKAAALEFGFTEAEVSGAVDHRMLQLVHYARLGKTAAENRNNAKRRVEAPKKGRTQAARTTPQEASQRKAKQRLSKTGSLEDAMRVNF